MEGCSAPLVVKFADTQKEKDAKRMHQLQSNLWNFASGLNSPVPQSPVALTTPVHQNPPTLNQSPFLAADALSPSSLQLLQQISAFGLQQQLLHGMTLNNFSLKRKEEIEQLIFSGLGAQSEPTATNPLAAAGLLGAPMSVQNLITLAAMTQPTLAASQSPSQIHNGASICKFL